MTYADLKDQLERIIEVHPEAGEAEIWSFSTEAGHGFHIKNISYDRRHKPPRIKLED